MIFLNKCGAAQHGFKRNIFSATTIDSRLFDAYSLIV